MSLRSAILAIALLASGGCATTPEFLPAHQQVVDDIYALGFPGSVAIDRGGVQQGYINTAHGPVPLSIGDWPWASVTKQVVAVMVMQQVEDGSIALDDPASRYLPQLATGPAVPTVRQLLRHQSGLRNPDETEAGPDGVPSFYGEGPTGLEWCLADRQSPPAEGWTYNNCDYIVLGAILESLGTPFEQLFNTSIAVPAGMSTTFLMEEDADLMAEDADPTFELQVITPADTKRIARYGTSAALVGNRADILRFDRALLDGKLLSEESRDILWQSDPALGYMALGQWVFEAPLEGCEAPVLIVERRGGIGRFQTRNILLPQRDTAAVFTTSHNGFEFGEIWTRQGFMYDALSKLACG